MGNIRVPFFGDIGVADRNRVVRYKMFRGTLASWEDLFDQAAGYASQLGQDRLIGISHSEDKDDGVVAVWFWSLAGEETR